MEKAEGSTGSQPSQPAHLLLDLGAVGQGVFAAVVDGHIAGWQGEVESVSGGDTPHLPLAAVSEPFFLLPNVFTSTPSFRVKDAQRSLCGP